MIDTSHLWVFLFSTFLLVVTPGTDTLYVLGRSLAGGTRHGVVAALGIGTGTLVHILAATLGISAVIAASATAFLVVKWVGAVYLAYLGLQMLLSRKEALHLHQQKASLPRTFWQGMLSNILNVKVALFFLAFLPQFVVPDLGHVHLQFLTLGLMFNTMGILWLGVVVCLTGKLAVSLQRAPSIKTLLNRFAGGVFLFFASRLALSER